MSCAGRAENKPLLIPSSSSSPVTRLGTHPKTRFSQHVYLHNYNRLWPVLKRSCLSPGHSCFQAGEGPAPVRKPGFKTGCGPSSSGRASTRLERWASCLWPSVGWVTLNRVFNLSELGASKFPHEGSGVNPCQAKPLGGVPGRWKDNSQLGMGRAKRKERLGAYSTPPNTHTVATPRAKGRERPVASEWVGGLASACCPAWAH